MQKHINYYESYNLAGDNLQQRQIEWMIWYSGVPERIANYYDEFLNTFSPRGGAQNVKFWGNQNSEQNNDFVHLPIAGDVAAVSANLLFSEPPEIETTQTRLEEALEENKFGQRIVHAAEISAAAGGVYLKVDTDQSQSEYPIVSIRYPDSAIPEFMPNGDLKAIKFHRVFVEEDKMYRLYEERKIDNGLKVEFVLRRVKDGKDGKRVNLNETEETKNLKPAYYPNYDRLGVVYIPNMLPNKQFPKSHEGISDYASCISLMDSLDEAWTSWVNDVTLGQGRVFVDKEILTMENEKFRFDPYQRVLMKVDMSSANMGDGTNKPIESVQFDIRADDHLKTCQSLTEQIISLSGYSPQSFGMDINGQAESGTALRIRERKSMLTKQKKSRYWMYGIQDFLTQMQEIDIRSNLSGSYNVETPSVVLADSVVRDPREVSETIRNLSMAEAISTYAKVKRANEDWTEEQIEEEVKKIQQERGMPLPEEMGG